MKGKVSIIIPVYNTEQYVEKCIRSIMEQSYKNLEIIIINDGSTDCSLKICEKLQKKDSRIIILNQKNKGVGEARNLGLNFCTGDYISFIDADDEIDLNYFDVLLCELQRYDLDMIGSNICVVQESNNLYPYEINGNILIFENNKIVEKYLKFKISTAIWGKLYKKELIGTTRFPKININEDFIFGWEIIKKCNKFLQVKNTHYNYFPNTPNSLTKQKFCKDNMSIIKHANEVLCDVYNLYPNLLLDAKNYFYACVLHNLIIYYIYLKNSCSKNLYIEEKRIMENLLLGQKKLNCCLLLQERDIEIDKLIEDINQIVDSKGDNKKCL